MSESMPGGSLEANPLIKRRRLVDDAHFDITAMVDLVFMMNIYFLVSWVVAAMSELDLPVARHCSAADQETAVVFSVTGKEGQRAEVKLGEGKSAEVVSDPTEVDQKVRAAVEAGMREGKTTVLIKAERDLRLKDVFRVETAASSVEGVRLYLAVTEKE